MVRNDHRVLVLGLDNSHLLIYNIHMRPGPKLKIETRACHTCGAHISRRPSEFRSALVFCNRGCSLIYRNKKNAEGKRIVKICPVCGLEFVVLACKAFRKFCSQKCMGISKRVIENRTCMQCGKGFIVDRLNPNGSYCSSRCYNESRARKQKTCGMCGSTFIPNSASRLACSHLCSGRLSIKNTPPDVMANKIRILREKRLANPIDVNILRASGVNSIMKLKEKYGNVRTMDTPIERMLYSALVGVGIHPMKQVPLLGITVVDLFVGPSICIYCDGMAWHSSDKAKTRDSRQNAALSAAGYKVFRFTGTDIRNNADACADQVLAYIRSRH